MKMNLYPQLNVAHVTDMGLTQYRHAGALVPNMSTLFSEAMRLLLYCLPEI